MTVPANPYQDIKPKNPFAQGRKGFRVTTLFWHGAPISTLPTLSADNERHPSTATAASQSRLPDELGHLCSPLAQSSGLAPSPVAAAMAYYFCSQPIKYSNWRRIKFIHLIKIVTGMVRCVNIPMPSRPIVTFVTITLPGLWLMLILEVI